MYFEIKDIVMGIPPVMESTAKKSSIRHILIE